MTQSTSTRVQGNLLIIGGAEDKTGDRLILRTFLKLAGGEQSKICVMTVATARPEETGRTYLNVFRELGAAKVDVLHLSSRAQAFQEEAEGIISASTGVFFTGGDQLRITSTLGGTPVDKALRHALARGAVIAGTSAGASAMSSVMIVEGRGEESPKKGAVRLAPGLRFLENAVIDQHFAQRGRIGRLLSAVSQNPYVLGIGVDEDTAILVSPTQVFRVIGSSSVTVVDGRSVLLTNVSELSPQEPLALSHVVLHVLPQGFGFDLQSRQPFSPTPSIE
ncbi:MAG: cyanophycinase [Bacillota bacterium]